MFERIREYLKEQKANRKPGPTLGGIVCFVLFSVILTMGTVKIISAGQATPLGIMIAVVIPIIFYGLTVYSIIRFIQIRRK